MTRVTLGLWSIESRSIRPRFPRFDADEASRDRSRRRGENVLLVGDEHITHTRDPWNAVDDRSREDAAGEGTDMQLFTDHF